eukprot:8062581-Lingulodinium_polyedra.AAC.1
MSIAGIIYEAPVPETHPRAAAAPPKKSTNKLRWRRRCQNLYRMNKLVAKLRKRIKALEERIRQLSGRTGRYLSPAQGMDLALRAAMSNQSANSIGM